LDESKSSAAYLKSSKKNDIPAFPLGDSIVSNNSEAKRSSKHNSSIK
jgi:hypothetical protein